MDPMGRVWVKRISRGRVGTLALAVTQPEKYYTVIGYERMNIPSVENFVKNAKPCQEERAVLGIHIDTL